MILGPPLLLSSFHCLTIDVGGQKIGLSSSILEGEDSESPFMRLRAYGVLCFPTSSILTLLIPFRINPYTDGYSWARKEGYERHEGLRQGEELTDEDGEDDV